MRNKISIINISSGILSQLILILSAFIIKNMFISTYGSTINGLVSSLEQIISGLAIVEAGIGTAAMYELYKPIHQKEKSKINDIMYSVKKLYIKSGIIYMIIILLMCIFYPYISNNKVSDYETRLLIIIISSSGVIEFLFFSKYKVLLNADQKLYIINILQTLSNIIISVGSIFLIYNQYNYIIIKAFAAIIIIIRFITTYMYFRKKYPYLSFKNSKNIIKIPQRWSVLIHQISGFAFFNTDLFIIASLSGGNSYIYVSIYSIYNQISTSVANLINSFSYGMVASLGNIKASDNESHIKKTYEQFEFIVFYIISIIYISFASLLYPFIKIYSKNFTDANYNNMFLVILFSIITVMQGLRIPSVTIVTAYGHFKQTQYRAALEATINILLSIILVRYINMYGVLIGTISAYLYRNIDLILYVNKYILKHTIKLTIKRLLIYTMSILLMSTINIKIYSNINIDSYVKWSLLALLTTITSTIYITIINFLTDKKSTFNIFIYIKNKIYFKLHSVN